MRAASPRFEPWNAEKASALVAAQAGREGPLLPVLHALNNAFGHIPDAAVPLVAQALNLSRAEVYGTISFYHDFKHAPPGRVAVKLCRAEACQAAGGEVIAARAEQTLGIKTGETTRDGQVTLEATYCLGLCPCGPAAMVNGAVVARLDQTTLDKLLAETGS